MPVYNIVSGDRFGQGLIEMPGIGLTDSNWTITIHDRPLLKTHKQLPRRRDQALPSIDLRSHYNRIQAQLPKQDVRSVHKSSPTPVGSQQFEQRPSEFATREPSELGRDDSSNAETTILRSTVTTPTHQTRPPTPDVTPPHPEPLLRSPPFIPDGPSISSRAESFKTAREELSSDEEFGEDQSPSQNPSRQKWLRSMQQPQMGALSFGPSAKQTDEDIPTPTKTVKRKPLPAEAAFTFFDGSWDANDEDRGTGRLQTAPSLTGTISGASKEESLPPPNSPPSPLPTPPPSAEIEEQPTQLPEPSVQRGKSLQDRLEQVRDLDSTENFARDIGWSHVYKSIELNDRIDSWRWSGISTTSTVEAIVVDADTPHQGQQRLRHSHKNPSLRSTSSPFPVSKRDSLFSTPGSPHRLVHKRGQITDQTRWSVDSEASKTMDDSHRPGVVHVAVIPERKSSLRSSENSSRRHSASLSITSVGYRSTATSGRSRVDTQIPLRKKRPMSSTLPAAASTVDGRGRDRQLGPTALPKTLSFSAPTSRSHSRANSFTSEHLRLRRLAAEEDLHRTLERMESERPVATRFTEHRPKKASDRRPSESNSDHVDVLSPWSPHSSFLPPPSMESASPGIVEMGEARTVNLFAHNNNSLQIIDQFAQPNLQTVTPLQQPSGPDRLPQAGGVSTPTQPILPQLLIDSPLRNPREPPTPPALQIIPPTPGDLTPVENDGRQSGFPSPGSPRKGGSISRRFGSLRRPALKSRHPSKSLVKSLSRTLSLRNSHDVKAKQPLDAHLHPFWKPRGFWDGITDSDSDQDDYDRDLIVSNSLGVPQQRTIMMGPSRWSGICHRARKDKAEPVASRSRAAAAACRGFEQVGRCISSQL